MYLEMAASNTVSAFADDTAAVSTSTSQVESAKSKSSGRKVTYKKALDLYNKYTELQKQEQ